MTAPSNPLPFASLSISPFSNTVDSALQHRGNCPRCNGSCPTFCYDCLIPVVNVERTPRVRLPVKIKIFVHFNERRGKATGLHAAVLAPDDAEVIVVEKDSSGRYIVPVEVEEQCNPETTFLLFPGSDAVTFSSLSVHPPTADSSRTTSPASPSTSSEHTLIFIDGTWPQAKSLLAESPFFGKFRKLTLAGDHRTLFWRHHDFGDTYLSTIECIYWACREWWEAHLGVYGETEWQPSAIPDTELGIEGSLSHSEPLSEKQGDHDQGVAGSSNATDRKHETNKGYSSHRTTETSELDEALGTTGTSEDDEFLLQLGDYESKAWASEVKQDQPRPPPLSPLRPLDELLFYFRHQYLLVRDRYSAMMDGRETTHGHRLAILKCAHVMVPGLEKPEGSSNSRREKRRKRRKNS
ncbi:hypothetical protein M427DRAFT_54658 [Gonapodya prolifera JEL478]|uniref:tRNA-uridine aminocarboxypropyltransferase 1 n=1 Tax=Gonapodya prolifera (strain JEL478) TaxID=1344416 RepID=A0A139AKP9_GONPJ|nr:hypothetical protein M427DRAFT_54658 [Gonapodya prolifera JEL478]|eukprot:KXS17371.1 hypothetical protein M427DRAFT_54658 [Gonapodya prolifera JEL478]